LRHKRNDFNNKKPYQRPSHASWNSSGQKHSSPANNSGITNHIKCFHCRGPHLSRNCTIRTITSFNCGNLGHYRNQCKELIKEQGSGGSINRRKNKFGRPKTTRRVFTMNDTEAVQSEDLIQGKCIINGHLVNVLYDSGSTHSFISHEYVKHLKLPISLLPYDLIVSTPTNVPITTSFGCTNCHICIGNRNFSVNLICLPLPHLDIILGMDWLYSNRVLLNCHDKTLIFESHIGEVFDSKELKESTTNHNEIPKGSQLYMILTSLKVKEIPNINKFPVVCEYLDVFPEDVLGLPPQREIEFTIDLVPGSRPVSVAPYRMSPLELVELKKQIEELLDK